ASTVCVGATTPLTDGASSLTWMTVNGNASVDPVGVVTGMTAGIDTILATAFNSCGADTATFIITVDPLPDAGVIMGPSAVCKGSSITLSDASAGGAWASSKPSVISITSGGVATGHGTGKVNITYAVTNSCGTDVTSDSISSDVPASAILDTGTSVCPGSFLGLLELTPGGTWSSSSFFTAFVTGTTVSGFEVGAVIGILPGVATITYTVNNGCGKSTATVDITVLSIEECNLLGPLKNNAVSIVDDGLKVYPNPSSGTFNLNLSAATTQDVQVVITNMVGESVSSFTTTTNKVNDITLDVPPGIYFINAATATVKYKAKVTITR
ncbi:MAG: surface protein, partial [Flavipsychrobacter sp.]|nr:surface protein [Flavipsychrobacter sp.]